MPDPIPLRPRGDDTAADVRSLERLGRIDPQPIPAPATNPPAIDPAPAPGDEAEMLQLSAALTEAGITPASEDQDAVRQLAKLDPATIATVQGWLKKKSKPAPGQSK
ncbi:hypothetical protein SUDANB1_07212 [Streptomyces sp. enrichment culture]|uniref:hypothetical protein n=1 Tax=Streptomyces sp. enrichment culture TaxID=1795815 RepID=UPI003F56621E